ncbi:hypothetical protein EN925_38660 [Mesorhizobium sp. M7A.F.Ca.US.006.04.2.1]|nr:hypothetical protein A9K65_033350 [Mesorhizobium sp. WSM1497]RUX71053.1 hypothetical protein EN990_29785 [Mesorhizobium sp. M7A.F.Ca.US.005.03.1.1]RUY16558.1 hypothetical protein EN991_10990 [Mesorhizobium sp. M7A.F.Ca.US.005.03.2.1]RUY22048.1 hypothetical protein EN979_32970 [Mesorhizobium sp. M7A.F.Ca.US.001.04.2.1]RUY35687.1 hypothetical protein EN978_31575 [Mesorhizobium sp. M7A.F.Ca.US.001.04.1.1]RUY88439.1 hypothetical protein EN974_31430 [Mesorhizobium sp. M7A.F.Ca.CA.001.12.2.1]RUZ
MDPATAAVLLLLSCSPGEAVVCRPIDAAPTTYASLDVCKASLKDRLAGAPNGEIVGRCHPLDETVTGSLPAGYTTVVVTRGVGSNAVSNSYIVQHKE